MIFRKSGHFSSLSATYKIYAAYNQHVVYKNIIYSTLLHNHNHNMLSHVMFLYIQHVPYSPASLSNRIQHAVLVSFVTNRVMQSHVITCISSPFT